MERYDLVRLLAAQLDMVEKTLQRDTDLLFKLKANHKNSICETCEYQSVGLMADHLMHCKNGMNQHTRRRDSVMMQCPYYSLRGKQNGLPKETEEGKGTSS